VSQLVGARAGAPEIRTRLLREALDQGLAGMAVALDEQARERLVEYLRLLERWNRTYNLTAVRDPLDMIHRHVLDSLAVLPYVRGQHCLDVGSDVAAVGQQRQEVPLSQPCAGGAGSRQCARGAQPGGGISPRGALFHYH
jgi:hypothetical protein